MHTPTENSSSSSGSNRRSLVVRSLVLWLIATVAGVLLAHGFSLGLIASWASLSWHKSLLYGLLLSGIAALPVVARYWRDTSPSEKTFAAGLIFCVLVGQTAGQSRSLFPFVEWSMFSHSSDLEKLLLIEYVGVTEQESRVRLRPGQIFPALGGGTLRYQNGLDLMVKGALTPAGGEMQHEFLTRMEASLAAMKRQYNRHHTEQPLTGIEVYLSGFRAETRVEPGPRKLAYSTAGPEITAAISELNQ